MPVLNLTKTILTTGLAAGAFPALRAAAPEKGATSVQRPNVIIILADDLGYGDLSCYGAKRVATPHVDSLAARGARFTSCYSIAATSTPSRYSLLTGEYAWRREGTDVAQGDAAMIIRPDRFTLADLFQSRGYATAAIGKWHLGLGHHGGQQDWNKPLDGTPADLGFDYHYIMAATGDRVPCVFIENGVVANYDPSAPIEVSYRRPFSGEPTGKDNPETLFNLRPSHGHNQSVVNGISRIGYMKGGGKALWKDENIADSIVSHAVDFIERQKGKPFFMYFATNDVHVPRFPHDRFRGKNEMGLRGDAIVQFDWTVGQITAALRRLGILDNTLILITSDNGPVLDDGYDDRAEELLGDHSPSGPYQGFKYSCYEGGTAVPLIVSWGNGVPCDTENHALVSQVDFLASFAQLLGASLPKGSAPDSRNQLPVLLCKRSVGREYVIEESNAHVLSVRTPKWKYIEPSDYPQRIPWTPKIETGARNVPQLFDMRASKWEEHNVASQHPKVVRQLQRVLQRERER